MSNLAPIRTGNKKSVCDVHRINRVGIHLIDYENDGIVRQNCSTSCFMLYVKAKKSLDPIWGYLKELMLKSSI